ncbi:MAG: maltooligosyl trehalose hydrolase [Acidobacteriales bacterium]|nr:maltooligosyl trehalose hydrolase [Terriglobales bacterium]
MKSAVRTIRLGASLGQGNTCEFRVWAPNAKQVALRLQHDDGAEQELQMRREEHGYFTLEASACAGDRYSYVVDDNKAVPDPVSRLLSEGVHGRTEIVDQDNFQWTDEGWRGILLRDYILYEIHVGTFSPEGTFDGVIGKLDYLKNELGVTAIELMPVAAFPGERNWGYDGVSPYAVQASYGGPACLKRLVNAAHEIGLAVVQDVVYNHLGNEGNYLRMFGPYFTDRHKTPWGDAINYDGSDAEGVREFVVQNALYWISEYHMDGLRLDAVQTIYDDSPKHILAEIKENVADLAQESGREVCIIAESDENDAKLVLPPARGGYGLDGFWSDDFHHAIHALLTDERDGYYQDFGKLEQIDKALSEGYVFQGEHFNFWKRIRGTPAAEVPLESNVICTQNHDQIGNRAKGERWRVLSSWGQRRAASALMLLAPHTPLLFMGQEYDETAPFQFFTSFGDPALAEAVRNGRREEFKDFAGSWNNVPDPQDRATFESSKLHWATAGADNEMLSWYRALIQLRKQFVSQFERRADVQILGNTIAMKVPASKPTVMVLANLTENELNEDAATSKWEKVLAATDEKSAVAVYVVT